MFLEAYSFDDFIRHLIRLFPSKAPILLPSLNRSFESAMSLLRENSIRRSEKKFHANELVVFVEHLMRTRQEEIRRRGFFENETKRPSYRWLCTQKEEPARLDPENLQIIRALATKASAEDCVSIAMRAEAILATTGKHLGVMDVPKLIIELLDNSQTRSILLSLKPGSGSILKRSQSNRQKNNCRVKFEGQPSYIVFTISKD